MNKIYVFMDLEYNSIDFRYSKFRKSKYTNMAVNNELIQISVIVSDECFNVIEKQNTYISPYFTEKISSRIKHILHYDNEFLKCYGIPFFRAVKRLNNMLASYESVTFVTFGEDDERVLDLNLKANNSKLDFKYDFVDVQNIFSNKYKILNEFGSPIQKTLQFCCEHEGLYVKEDALHDSEYDTEILFRLTKVLCDNSSMDNCLKYHIPIVHKKKSQRVGVITENRPPKDWLKFNCKACENEDIEVVYGGDKIVKRKVPLVYRCDKCERYYRIQIKLRKNNDIANIRIVFINENLDTMLEYFNDGNPIC